jgi:DNA-binding response OmpR family regulator
MQVLVLDRHADAIEALRANLETRGYHVLAATDRGECVEIASSQRPNVVLLESHAPGRAGGEDDGLEALRRIRSVSNVPIIMRSASATASDRADGLKMGADDYLTEPYSVEELVARMQSILRRTQSAPQGLRRAV